MKFSLRLALPCLMSLSALAVAADVTAPTLKLLGTEPPKLGATDAHGVLMFPVSLYEDGAMVHAKAVGSNFSVYVQGASTRDSQGRRILLLEPPPGK